MSEQKRNEFFDRKKIERGGEERDYFCGYCGNKFKMVVSSTGEGNAKCSTGVKCKNCGNMLPTWR